jgi:hypothetical protein
MRILLVILCAQLFGISSEAQIHRRALVRIDSRGMQEAIQLSGNESVPQAIANVEAGSASMPDWPVDTLFVYDKTGESTNTAFSFNHQDVALQWYVPGATCRIKEFWFNTSSGYTVGIKHKARVRAWHIDPRITSLPATAVSKSQTDSAGNMGYYHCASDGDGLKTPFRDEATDTTFVKGLGDLGITFDPLASEIPLVVPGGVIVDIEPGRWYKVLLPDSAQSPIGSPFGFTVQNLTTVNDITAGETDTALVLGAQSSIMYPYHSMKFYEATAASNYGWQIRAYEWRFLVVVEYLETPPPKIRSLQQLYATLKTTPRPVSAAIVADDSIQSVELCARINSGVYEKSAMTGMQPNYTGTLPGANPGDTVSYYVVATGAGGISTTSVTYQYTIFAPKYKYLCIWNGRTLPTGWSSKTLAARYMKRDSIGENVYYDLWEVKSNGKGDIPDLLKLYNLAVEMTGDGGYSDLSTTAGDWLATGTPTSPKTYLLSDQDHFFISDWDTAFSATDAIYEYFGIQQAAPQDYPYTGSNVTWPWRITPQDSTDVLTGFIQKWVNKTGTTFWYHPNFEWPPFLNWMDELQPTADAKILFKDGARVVGVRKDAIDNSWHTMFLAFDYLSTDFRSDTARSLYATPDKDPKYAKITDAGSLVGNAIKAWTSVRPAEGIAPSQFSLSQNYPNPFNPSTTISFDIPKLTHVSLVVYDYLGREVATVVNGQRPAGHYQEKFSAAALGSGVYFYRVRAGEYSAVKKMLVLK